MDHKREHRTPPLARVMGVGRQQQPYGGNVLEYGSCYGFVCCDDRFPHVVDVSALSICIVLRAFVVVIYMCLWNTIFELALC